MNEWQDMITTLYKNGCRLCPRECSADRIHGQTGFCGMTDELMAARAALHYWEEPCISGTEGSGILFRLYTSMCVLSECRDCCRPCWKDAVCGSSGRHFFGVAGEKS